MIEGKFWYWDPEDPHVFHFAADYWDDEVVGALGREAKLLYVTSIAWSVKHGTPGKIGHETFPSLAENVGLDGPTAATSAAAKLVEAGLWGSRDAGWVVC